MVSLRSSRYQRHSITPGGVDNCPMTNQYELIDGLTDRDHEKRAKVIADLANPEGMKILATLPLKNSVVGHPVNVDIDPTGSVALVAPSVDVVKDGDALKQTLDNKIYVIDMKANPPKLAATDGTDLFLNPEGINAFRFFEGRGFRLWGARTVSSDPEWKYVNLRRYFAYLERSIDKGTQWAVFEPNGEQLWANVRRTIEEFLLNEWQSGALLGDKPEKSYFVRCDRSTMTQNDLDNGRLICLIGVAPLRPAEFVIFRIGQWTADRKS